MLRNSSTRWGLVSILFHWVMAGLFFYQFWLGLTMVAVANPLERYALYQEHKSWGFLILALALLRLLWRLSGRRPALPESMPEGERALATGSHRLLYAALIIIPLTGWAVVSVSPLPIASWFFGLFIIPSLPLTPSVATGQIWGSVHAMLAYTALFLAGVHTLAAFRHQFQARDGLIGRMLWPKGK